MRVDVLTIFPGIFEGPLRESLLGRAIASGLLDVRVHDIRDFATDRHRQVDDEPFGGGPGMVMKPEPVFAAVESLGEGTARRTILLSPAGRRLDQALVRELSAEPWLVLICGRYEGVDERVAEGLPAEEVSIGDFVLSGGEIPALVVLEAVTRLVPGVVGKEESLQRESFEEAVLDHPHYTRPREFRGMDVPEALMSGNHAAIEAWRRQAALDKTRRNRPDLLPER
ncbi:MAG: tRNA (guanosine(37)-N1)-methyltransferase TrmD [Actinomycetota bacterium]|nr:tRNA (guanosine(37)-N1)-methyltransferase TrmD [Actinomycetota bacterium]